MKDIMNICKKYGVKIGLIAIAYFIIAPINMMIEFAWNGYRYDTSILNILGDICLINLLFGLARDLKYGDKEYLYSKMPLYLFIAIPETLIFAINSITTIVLIITK